MTDTTTTNKNGRLVAIITMCFIFAMISFVTNMAAPFGNIWKGQYSWAAMMGNMMNFAAYLFQFRKVLPFTIRFVVIPQR